MTDYISGGIMKKLGAINVIFLWESWGEFWPIRAAKGEDAIGLAVTHCKLRVSWSTPKSEAVEFSET
jgi:hypothetical protein